MSPAASTTDRRWLALALLCAAQFVVVLDASIVNVALPSIGSALHFSEANLQWVVSAYVLVFGGFLLLGGRAADLLGRRRVFMTGLVIFAIASLAGGLAPSEGWLIAARAVQGFGGALFSPAALSIITTTFTEGSERNKALGAWGAVAGSGGAVGVLLGGVLTDGPGWEWIFFVNTPICLGVAALTPGLIAESRADVEHRSYDVAGAVTVTAGLSLLVYALVQTYNHPWGSLRTILLLAGAVALLAAFVVVELRTRWPLVPFRIFRLRNLRAANIISILIGASLFSMFYFVSLYMQQVLGFSPLKAGLSYLPLALMIIVSAGIASQLVERLGVKPVLITGMVAVAAGLILFTGISPKGSFASDVLLASVIAALGLGFSFVPVTIASMMGVEPGDAGLASGLINTTQQVGGALGLAVLATVANSTIGDALAHGSARPVALTNGFQDAFTVGAAFAIAGALLSFVLLSSKRDRAEAESAEPALEAA